MKFATTLLVFCVCALLMLGLVILYSAGMSGPGAKYMVSQLVWAVLGVGACVAATTVDYRHLKKISWILLGLSVLLLVAVLIPGIGKKVGGARRWLSFAGFTIQPSELAKIALIIALAHYAELQQRHMKELKRGLLLPGLGVVVVLGLIFREPDYGTTMLLGCVAGILLLLAGVRWLYLIPPVVVGLTGFVLAIAFNPIRLSRVLAWLNPEAAKDGVGYQSHQAMLALGSGGITGLGLGNSRQKLGFVPEHHTDFIFSVIGEELGLIGSLVVVALFIALVVSALYIARGARDNFGFHLAAGVAFLIGLQAFINIGVVTSTLPNKGLPLPFVSYGGSNLFMMLTAVGLVLSVARRAEVREKSARSNPFGAKEIAGQFT
ncbi:MAG: putative lipid II flippase FtsW [Verrucomicrobia bacterium]|nr:putative lipid II flippase FtsW [Verrucomicrobiota bacterium]